MASGGARYRNPGLQDRGRQEHKTLVRDGLVDAHTTDQLTLLAVVNVGARSAMADQDWLGNSTNNQLSFFHKEGSPKFCPIFLPISTCGRLHGQPSMTTMTVVGSEARRKITFDLPDFHCR